MKKIVRFCVGCNGIELLIYSQWNEDVDNIIEDIIALTLT